MKNIGIFTKNANIKRIMKFNLYIKVNIIINERFLFKIVILISKGREAKTVYIIK